MENHVNVNNFGKFENQCTVTSILLIFSVIRNLTSRKPSAFSRNSVSSNLRSLPFPSFPALHASVSCTEAKRFTTCEMLRIEKVIDIYLHLYSVSVILASKNN